MKVARGIGCFLRASFSEGWQIPQSFCQKGDEAFMNTNSLARARAKSTTIAATVFLLPALLLIVIFMIYPVIDTS